MRLANGIVIDKEATFGALKFSALRREVHLQNEDGSVSEEIKERTYDLKSRGQGRMIQVSIPASVPLKEFDYNAEVELINPVADTVATATFQGACYPAPLVLQIILISVKLNEGTDSDILMFFTAECLNRYLLVLSYQSYKNSRYLPDQSLTPAIITIQCTTTSLDWEMMHQRYDNNYSTF